MKTKKKNTNRKKVSESMRQQDKQRSPDESCGIRFSALTVEEAFHPTDDSEGT